MIYLALASFLSVFCKGFQSQNIIGGKFKAAFVVSYIMAILDVLVIVEVSKNADMVSAIYVGLGASLGIVASMFAYRKIHKET